MQKATFITLIYAAILLSAKASTLGVDVASGFQAQVSGPMTIGWEFSVSASNGIVVDGLAFWDAYGPGFFLEQTFPVGLWEASTGTLLRDTIITSDSTLEPSLAVDGDWRVNSVSPLLLAPGLYRIGAFLPFEGANPVIITEATLSTAPGVSVVRYLRHVSPTLAMPDIAPALPDRTFFGPTFTFTLVPEPDALLLLIMGFAVFGVAYAVRRAIARRTSGLPT